ncbi:MAG: putative metal-dependent phosphoesterase TrpH [Enterobacterales bacterium]|jgi:predicted metal-dependent phosphoesterase TrpH
MTLKIDLHCHTQHSDGGLSCQELIERAVEKGVDVLAISDHDTTAAHLQAADIAKDLPIKIMPAVEVSTVCENQELHIVGLGVDINNQALQNVLHTNRQLRRDRTVKILEKFQKSGLDDLSSPLEAIVTGEVVCRSHLAQLLCNEGIVKDFQRAFKQYLGKKGKAWVPVVWQDVSLVIKAIKEAGGVAILAHPSKYKLSPTRLAIIIEAFVKAGGEAIEIAYPGLNPSDRAMLVRQVNLHQLAVSQGSDFHHPKTSWTELGAFGVREDAFKVVWQHFGIMETCH